MKFMTSKKAVQLLAKRSGLSQAQVAAVCQAQAELVRELAEQGFPFPGIGVLCLVEHRGREITMTFGHDKGKVKKVRAYRNFHFYRCVSLNQFIKSGKQTRPLPSVLEPEMEFGEGEFE